MIDRKKFWSIRFLYSLNSIIFINWEFKFSKRKKKLIFFRSIINIFCARTIVLFFASYMTIACFCRVYNQNCKIEYAFFNVAKITSIDLFFVMLSWFEIEFFVISKFNAFDQIFHQNNFIFHFHIAFSFVLHDLIYFHWLCFDYSINLRLLSTNNKIHTHCSQTIKFANNNSSYIWIFTKSSFCFFILQIQRNQRLNVFSTMSSIFLTIMSRRKNDENVF